MSDLGKAAWTGTLFADNNGVNLVTNMFDATMNRQVDSTGLEYSASRNEAATTVVVNTPKNVREGEHLIAQVFDSNGNEQTVVTFGKKAEKKYSAIVPTTKTDETYTIKLMLVDDASSKINDVTTFAVTGYYNEEYDVFSTSGQANLTGIVNNGHGEVLPDTNGLFDDTIGETQILEYDVSTPVAIAALILFVLDILFRTIVIKRKKQAVQMSDEEQLASMRGR